MFKNASNLKCQPDFIVVQVVDEMRKKGRREKRGELDGWHGLLATTST